MVAGMIGLAGQVPTDVFTDGVSELRLTKRNGDAVQALRARLSSKVVSKFEFGKLKSASSMTTLAAVMLNAADKGVVLAAADAASEDAAVGQRFLDYLNSKDDILPFDLTARLSHVFRRFCTCMIDRIRAP